MARVYFMVRSPPRSLRSSVTLGADRPNRVDRVHRAPLGRPGRPEREFGRHARGPHGGLTHVSQCDWSRSVQVRSWRTGAVRLAGSNEKHARSARSASSAQLFRPIARSLTAVGRRRSGWNEMRSWAPMQPRAMQLCPMSCCTPAHSSRPHASSLFRLPMGAHVACHQVHTCLVAKEKVV